MNVAITGASGMIGKRLRERLVEAGIRRCRFRARPATPRWQKFSPLPMSVVHLAGEPVAQRWTEAAKKRIHDSRVEGTRRLVNALSTQSRRPRVLVCASAVGYYGSRGDQILTEASSPATDFLARVVVDWEEAAQLAEALGIRVVRLRFGMVLGQGGALAKLLPPFRFGVGGRLGSGHQWMAWIHIGRRGQPDTVRPELRGHPRRRQRHRSTSRSQSRNSLTRLAIALHRPAIFPVPAFAFKLALGEMSEMVLASQRVLPTVAKSAGFRFQYPELRAALENLLPART